MKITFLGATRMVTGSCYLIETGGRKVLVDCGMFQGSKLVNAFNERDFVFNPAEIDAMVLTHAHIDHSGLIPKLVAQGYKGPVYCTKTTLELCGILLPDSAHIHESDAEFANRKGMRAGRKFVKPLYTVDEAYAALKNFAVRGFDEEFDVIPGIKAKFKVAGHIAGSAIAEIFAEEDGKKTKIILISVIAVVLVILIAVGIWFFTRSNGENGQNSNDKLSKLYETLQNKDSYSYTSTLDDNNQFYYAKYDGKAYTKTNYNGNESVFLIRDGNSYLIRDTSKTYYTYANNEIDLYKIELALSELVGTEHGTGNEEIDGKNYDYEEYTGATTLALMSTSSVDEEEVKTRFYFKGDDLVYIKTIAGETQELLKIEISDEVDTSLFEIPSDYQSR